MTSSLRTSALALCFSVLLQFHVAAAETPKVAVTSATCQDRTLTSAQKRGLALLQQAEASAPDLSPEMRVFILTKISDGYEKFDPARRTALLQDAFRASTLIPDGECPSYFPSGASCGDSSGFQTDILQKLAWLAPEETERLMPQAQPFARRTAMERLVDYYLWKRDFDHAARLLRPYENDANFPYQSVMSIMRALPPARSADRVTLFSAALANFRQSDRTRNYGSPDLGDLVLQFWSQLPPDLVLQASDALLDQAKETADGLENIQRNISSRNGNLSLDAYQYRIFQLLPVLRELNPSRAAALLLEQKPVSTLTAKYPAGLTSFAPLLAGTHGGTTYESVHMSSTTGVVAPSDKQNQLQKSIETVDAQQHQVQTLLGSSPDRAFELAKKMPLWTFGDDPHSYSPRANAMLGIADVCAKNRPEIALQALQEAQKVMEEGAPSNVMQILTQSGNLYLAQERQNELKKLLRRGGKLAEKFYAADTDSADPNQAPKRNWPSTDCWRRVVVLAAQFSPEMAEQWLSRIPDPEIQAMERVSYGSALLGATDSVFLVAEHHKKYSRSFSGN